MKVILIKDHPKLGKKFETKNVNPGYAKNFLLPREIAIVATSQNLASVQRLQNENQERKNEQNKSFDDIAGKIKNISIEIHKKANKEGKLFASITEKEIRAAVKVSVTDLGSAYGVEMDKHIKEIGSHEIKLEFGGKKIPLKLEVKEDK
jgi:large subunit ribosomal protein L9